MTPDEIASWRKIVSDVETGRKFACFAFKAMAVLGAIASSSLLILGSAMNDWHMWRH